MLWRFLRVPLSASRDRSSPPSARWKRHPWRGAPCFHSAPKDGRSAACWIAIPGPELSASLRRFWRRTENESRMTGRLLPRCAASYDARQGRRLL